MRVSWTGLAIGILPLVFGDSIPDSADEHMHIRGKSDVSYTVRTTKYPQRKKEAYTSENIAKRLRSDPLVDSHNKQQTKKLRGTSRDSMLSVDHVEPHLEDHTSAHQTHQYHHNEHGQSWISKPLQEEEEEKEQEQDIQRGRRRQETEEKTAPKKPAPLYVLPTASDEYFNQSLFEHLNNAPFDLYEQALGHHKADYYDVSLGFPVFTMPTWHNTTGIFSGFSKTAVPMIFENTQILLDWKNILATSNGASRKLIEFIGDSNFHASLIIAKCYGGNTVTHFIGLVVSYYQFGVEKNILVPFARVEDFFEDMAHSNMFDPSTKHLEVEALNRMLNHKQPNMTVPHQAMQIRDARQVGLENFEINRFQQLFQVLIRRSFLFSFGYADCLHQDPYNLRQCLGETFKDVVKLETNVRGSLDAENAAQLEAINDVYHSNVSEACIMVQGGRMDYVGRGSCYDMGDVRSFVHSSIA
jgi:hypothetical protein